MASRLNLAKPAGRIACVAAGTLLLALLANGLWPTNVAASAAMAAAGAAATSEANKCGAQFNGGPLYNCVANAADRLAGRIQGEGNAGASIANSIRTAAATIRQGSKQGAVAALSQARSVITGFLRRIKDKRGGDTPGMNALSGAMSTMIRVIQSKG